MALNTGVDLDALHQGGEVLNCHSSERQRPHRDERLLNGSERLIGNTICIPISHK